MNTQSNVRINNQLSRSRRRLLFCRPASREGLALVMVLAFVLCLAVPAARATLMVYEGFNYSTGSGNLTGLSGSFGWNGIWQTINGSSSSVQAGSLAAGANAPAGYDALSTGNSAFTPNGTRTGRFLDTSASGLLATKGYIDGNGNIGASGKTIYISFMQQPNAANDKYYEFEFHKNDLGDSGRRAGVGNDTGGSGSVYLRTPSAGQTLIGPGSASVSFYVVRIDFLGGNDTVYVYQNPTSATEPGSPTLLKTGAGDMSFNGISFGAFVNGRTVTHDEVRVGETWADVTAGSGTYGTGNWDGGGVGGNWSTAANWAGDVVPTFATALTFAGSVGLNSTNDYTGVIANGITFDSAAGAFTLSGNSLKLGVANTIGFNGTPSSPVTQTINMPLAPSGNFTIDTRTNGSLTINGNITMSTGALISNATNGILTQTSAGNAGTLTLAGTNTLNGFVVNGGTNRITGSTTITLKNTRFCLANQSTAFNATMIIEPGANLTVSGTGVDAGVIGRDGGVGRVIQNGGTFSFNIPNNNKLFINASSNTGANGNGLGVYSMNGGLFDMNNNILSPGLGVNNVVLTGYVNQVGGVISNVLQLVPGWNSGQNGRGVYNLTGGTMYITGTNGVGITSQSGKYDLNLGGGTIAALGSWSSALNMNLTGNNGPVTFNPNGNTITLSGVLSGTGGLNVNGAGVLALDGANTYTGIAHVTAGSTLQFDFTGTTFGSIRLDNGATLSLNYSGTRIVGSFYTNGVALPVGTYDSSLPGGFIVGSGQLQVASGISTGIWDGGGADSNWSTGANWDQDAVPVFPIGLTFQGSTRLTNNNNLSSITASSITFDAAAGAFELDGNDITLSGNVGFNGNPAAPITQTVNLNMAWNADKTIDTPANGNLTLGGNINASANSLVKIDTGTLTLGGSDTFAGFSVNGGTSIITGSTTVSGVAGKRIYVGDGVAVPHGIATLVVANGGTFTLTGTFDDYFVIGRDTAYGRVIQTGGTFNFNTSVNAHPQLLVGAGGAAGAVGEYDISGGVLNMNGLTLGVAWGDGGVVTGVVNQTGGNINNLFKLDLGTTKANGYGVFNLTGGSVAIDFGGIVSDNGHYQINLGGGTMSAIFDWASSLNMNLTNINGSVAFDPAGNTITLSGALSGNGGLIVTNTGFGGTLVIGGVNTYTGDTIVSAGATLQYNVSGVSYTTLRVVDGAMLNLNYSGTRRVPAFYTNGVALPDGIYNTGNLPGFIVAGSGDLLVSSGISAGIWDGGGANSYWSTVANWDNDVAPVFPISLTFSNNLRLVNTNDLSSVTANNITFDANAGAFVLNGNSLGLGAFANIAFSAEPPAPVTQTLNLPLATAGDITVGTRTNGNITINSNITGGNQLTQAGPANAGVLTLTGNNALKGLVINNGTNRITGNTTVTGIGGSSFFYVGDIGTTRNATLVIENGATFTISGGFQDSAVIGRDGSIGKIIQNGGTFNFNITSSNQRYLFVGATGDSNTRAEYDMNAGLLDMNGCTLGLCLSGASSVTGTLNQIGGVITNVGNLRFNPLAQSGTGIYNLTGGSIYIGSGGITVDSGAYQVNLGGGTVGSLTNWSSSLNMTLTGVNGPLTFDTAANTNTLSGALTGSGGLTKVGNGTLELSGADTYTGNTTVNAGILKLDVAGTSASAIHIVNGAMLDLNYGGTITVPACYTNGVALASGVYTSANLPAFITGTGSLTIPAAAPGVVNPPVSSGGNLILTGTGWTPSAAYVWLVTTNLTPPVIWTTNTSGNFDGSGNFSNAIPVSASTPAAFFRLRTP